MPQLLSLSRAARLAGVSRGDLQKRIREDDVKTFEGKLTTELLVALYPHIDMSKDAVFERVQRIKAEARPKTHQSDGWLPDPEVLMSRLKGFQHTLVQTKAALNASESLLNETLTTLQHALAEPPVGLRAQVEHCIDQLNRAMARLDRAADARAALFAKDALLQIVTASVRLLPSGHEFLLEGNDSILDAGLKAGLYMDYGCTSGNCGACKCKVVSGAVQKIRNHDYVLSAREQEDGYVLACCNTAISDLVLEAKEAGSEERLPCQEIRAVVRKTEPEGPDLTLIHVQTPRTQSMRFKAGQWVMLTAEDGSRAKLFVASCPCDGRNLQFLVNKSPDDPFSQLAFSDALAKQTVVIEGPEGGFVLQEDSHAPAVFLCKGNGLAPIKSLVEQAITIDNAESLHFIHLGAMATGTHLDNLCRSWTESLDNFSYSPREADLSVENTVALLRDSITQGTGTEVYVAGPAAWLEAIVSASATASLDTSGWHTERTI